MSKYIAVIPRAAITRAALVEAGGRSMEQVKAAFDRAGIEMTYNHLNVHMVDHRK